MRRRPVPVPWAYLPVVLADRFGGYPWEVRAAPAADVLATLAVLGVEGEILAALEGLKPDEPMIWMDDE